MLSTFERLSSFANREHNVQNREKVARTINHAIIVKMRNSYRNTKQL